MAREKQIKLPRKARHTLVELVSYARIALLKIAYRAEFEGDAEAAEELYSCAASAVNWLDRAIERRPALFKRIAQRQISWPVEYSRHPEDRSAADALMEKLDVGAAAGINLSGGKSFSWDTPAAQIAYYLVEVVRAVQQHRLTNFIPGRDPLEAFGRIIGCKKLPIRLACSDLSDEQIRALDQWGHSGPGSNLPSLTRETAPQWQKAIGHPFRIIFGRNYERDRRLSGLRASIKTWNGDGVDTLRSRMLNEVKQAIESIATLK